MVDNNNRIVDKLIGGNADEEGTLNLKPQADAFAQKCGFKDGLDLLHYMFDIIEERVAWEDKHDNSNPHLEKLISELIERGYINPHKQRKQKNEIHPHSEHGAIDS